MANNSIKTAFERMWQHITSITDDKADVNHDHNNDYDAKGAAADAESNANKYTDNAVAGKANTSALDTLAAVVNTKADTSALNTLSNTVAGKADTSALNALSNTVSNKADANHDHDDDYYLKTEIDNKVSAINNSINGKAPTSHASTATTYGAGTGDKYGHVKLSDSTSSDSSINNGIAATPAAVKAAYDLANGKADEDHNHDDDYYDKTSGDELATTLGAVKEDVDAFFKNATISTEAKDTLKEIQDYITSDATAASNMLSSINNKADKNTTLSGYGITNAYTKTEIDTKISNLNTAIGEKAPTGHTHDDRYYTETEVDTKLGNKLNKTTYEYNKELALGSSGKVCIGKFPMYDSNISVEIKSTTSTTFHGTLVIATQNINTTGGGSYTCKVYGDADNSLTGSIKIHYGSGSNVFSVYIDLPTWSKNLLHIQCVSLAGTPTDIATQVSAIPSNATIVPTNAIKAQLDTKAANSNFVKSGSGAKAGLVPAPSTTAGTTKYLREDGTWAVPPDNNTDTKVTQAAAITTDGNYPVILGNSTATTAVTGAVNKSAGLIFNPKTGTLYVNDSDDTGKLIIGDWLELNDSGNYSHIIGGINETTLKIGSGKLLVDDVEVSVAGHTHDSVPYAEEAGAANRANLIAYAIGSSNYSYPLLFGGSASGVYTAPMYDSSITVNPSTDTITATTFKGKLDGNATSATKATQDASGNTITSTYMPKSGGTFTGEVSGTEIDLSGNLYIGGGIYTNRSDKNLNIYADGTLWTSGSIATNGSVTCGSALYVTDSELESLVTQLGSI